MMKYELVSQALESTKGCASDMTHALSDLGDGDMGAGIVELWKDGLSTGLSLAEVAILESERRGALKGAAFTVVVVVAGLGIRKYQERRRNKILYGKVNTAAVFEDWCTTGICPFWSNAKKGTPSDIEESLDIEEEACDKQQEEQKQSCPG